MEVDELIDHEGPVTSEDIEVKGKMNHSCTTDTDCGNPNGESGLECCAGVPDANNSVTNKCLMIPQVDAAGGWCLRDAEVPAGNPVCKQEKLTGIDKDADYRGLQTQTRSGLTCQAWS